MPTPTRRVILLGASNVALSFATIVQTIRRTWNEPVEIMAAMGYGRSYGQDSWVLGRKISGIFSCALWQDLQERPPMPTAALLTDVGNDLLYGATPDCILEWVAGCLDRVAEVDTTTIVTELPISSLERLSETRFRLFRALFFPRSELTLEQARASAVKLNDGLARLGCAKKLSVIPVSEAWYGLDPIHLRPSAKADAWPKILSSWREGSALAATKRPRLLERAYVSCLSPRERSIFGLRRRAEQPTGQFSDGTTISLY